LPYTQVFRLAMAVAALFGARWSRLDCSLTITSGGPGPVAITRNRERLLEAEVANKFLAELLNHKEVRGLLSDQYFSVDGTQVAVWASMKSFRRPVGDQPLDRAGSSQEFRGHHVVDVAWCNAQHSRPAERVGQRMDRGRAAAARLNRRPTPTSPGPDVRPKRYDKPRQELPGVLIAVTILWWGATR
jgi:hypothetical protein